MLCLQEAGEAPCQSLSIMSPLASSMSAPPCADLSLGAEPVYRLNRWGLAGPASTLTSLDVIV